MLSGNNLLVANFSIYKPSLSKTALYMSVDMTPEVPMARKDSLALACASVLCGRVTLPSGGAGCDGSVLSWRDGTCKVQPEFVSIPFSEIGDFVYHCHIGEHQDGGMMAHIRVIANP
jgi:hypothetical protein